MKTSRQVINASIVVEDLRHEAGVDVTIDLLSSETRRNGIVWIVSCSICTRLDQKATISMLLVDFSSDATKLVWGGHPRAAAVTVTLK